ncbi:MAG: hypothetical protein IID38_02525 [Planctomycetes bacterium]|nr:hypothetical protein [Planctomycetota bacterium]
MKRSNTDAPRAADQTWPEPTPDQDAPISWVTESFDARSAHLHCGSQPDDLIERGRAFRQAGASDHPSGLERLSFALPS